MFRESHAHSRTDHLFPVQTYCTGALSMIRPEHRRASKHNLMKSVFRYGEMLRNMKWDDVPAQAVKRGNHTHGLQSPPPARPIPT